MSKLLNNLSNLGNAASDIGKVVGLVSGIGSAVSGVSDLLGFGGPSQEELQAQALKLQYEYQTKLNEQQQGYARENAQTEYERQRQMARDQYSLNKQGMQDAGLSVVGDAFRASSPSVPSISSPNAGSVGMPQLDAGLQYKQMDSLINVASLLSNIQKQSKEIEGIELDNKLKAGSLLPQLSKLKSESKSAEYRATIDKWESIIKERFSEKDAEFDNIIKGVTADFAKKKAIVDYQQSLQILRNLQQTYKKGTLEYKQLQTNIKTMEEEYKQLVVSGSYQPAMLQADLENKRADTSNKIADTTLKGYQGGLVQAQTEKTRYDTVGVKQQNEFWEKTKSLREDILFNERKSSILRSYPESIQQIVFTGLFNPDAFPELWSDSTPEERESVLRLLGAMDITKKFFSGMPNPSSYEKYLSGAGK